MGSAFHDGTRMSTADLLYAYMFAYRWGADDARRRSAGRRRDRGHAGAASGRAGRWAATAARSPIGSGTSRSPASCSWSRSTRSAPPVDREQDAVVAPPWSTLPWHLMVLMEEAVARGWAAFSQAEAQRRGVEWLDLVRSDRVDHATGGAGRHLRARGLPPRPSGSRWSAPRMPASAGPRSPPSTGSAGTSWSPTGPISSSAGRTTRHARGVPRSQLSARRRFLRRLCGAAPRLHHRDRA